MLHELKRHNRTFLLEEKVKLLHFWSVAVHRNSLSDYLWNTYNMRIIPVAQHQESRKFMVSTVQFSLSLWPNDWVSLFSLQQQYFWQWYPGFCWFQNKFRLCVTFFREGEWEAPNSCLVTEHQAGFFLFFLAQRRFGVGEIQTMPQPKSCPLLCFMLTFSWDEVISCC